MRKGVKQPDIGVQHWSEAEVGIRSIRKTLITLMAEHLRITNHMHVGINHLGVRGRVRNRHSILDDVARVTLQQGPAPGRRSLPPSGTISALVTTPEPTNQRTPFAMIRKTNFITIGVRDETTLRILAGCLLKLTLMTLFLC